MAKNKPRLSAVNPHPRVIPVDDVWDEKWDGPLSSAQWNAVRWLYEKPETVDPDAETDA